jgi:hypothetical protein
MLSGPFRLRGIIICVVLALGAAGQLTAAEKSKPAKKKSAPAKTAPVAKPPPPAPPAPPAATRRLEPFVLLPEPKEMRTERSKFLPQARLTVITAAQETAERPGVRAYTKEEFARLGISLDTFIERARAAADARLAGLQPDFVRDAAGAIRYAVYRGESPLVASLLMAPSLGRIFKNIFGDEVWVVLPDRHSLYVFPAKAEALAEFGPDLQERFMTNAWAACAEVFLLKADAAMPQVVGTFVE